MRVLIACEFSGAVRDAFTAAGHDAMSCDLLPTESPGPHYRGDVFDVLDDGWDLMIAHPPCTYLCNSGVRWLSTDIARWSDMIDGAVFFRRLLNAPIPRIAVENPMFGHPETKATGLWLKGLPPLIATEDVRDEMRTLPANERARIHYAAPGPDRWKLRSATYTGIARAFAQQWGCLDEGIAA